jgi:hypothetical protein
MRLQKTPMTLFPNKSPFNYSRKKPSSPVLRPICFARGARRSIHGRSPGGPGRHIHPALPHEPLVVVPLHAASLAMRVALGHALRLEGSVEGGCAGLHLLHLQSGRTHGWHHSDHRGTHMLCMRCCSQRMERAGACQSHHPLPQPTHPPRLMASLPCQRARAPPTSTAVQTVGRAAPSTAGR